MSNGKFEIDMGNTFVAVKATQEQMKEITESVLNIARKTQFSPTEVASALFFGVSAGLDVEEALATIIYIS